MILSMSTVSALINNNNNKRPLTPKSMPPAGDEHASALIDWCIFKGALRGLTCKGLDVTTHTGFLIFFKLKHRML